jgi:hypothetical protein
MSNDGSVSGPMLVLYAVTAARIDRQQLDNDGQSGTTKVVLESPKDRLDERSAGERDSSIGEVGQAAPLG